MTPDLLLFDSAGSPCARRVKIALVEKHLPFDRIELDLGAMEQKRPGYLALNPNGVVPTLAHGNLVLFEANVITRYLDEAFPDTPQLYPSDTGKLAEVFDWQASEILMAKRFRPLLYQRLLGPLVRLTKTKEEALAQARVNGAGHEGIAWETRVWSVDVISLEEEAELVEWHHGWLGRLDTALSDRPFLLGEACSMADISVAPRVGLYPVIGMQLAGRFPNVAGWIERMDARPSLAETRSTQEIKLHKLAQSPVLPAAGRLYRKEGRASLLDRAIVSLARPVLRKVLAKAAKIRPAFEIPNIASQPRPMDQKLCSDGVGLTLDSVKIAGRPNDPVFRVAGLLAQWTGAKVQMQTRDVFAVEIDGRSMSAPNEVLEHLAAADQESHLLQPGTAQQAARLRGWLAFAQGSEKEFRPFCKGTAGNTGLDRFVTDKSMAKVEINRRIGVLERHLSGAPCLAGPEPSLADLRWWFELDALQSSGFEVAAPSILDWMSRVSWLLPESMTVRSSH